MIMSNLLFHHLPLLLLATARRALVAVIIMLLANCCSLFCIICPHKARKKEGKRRKSRGRFLFCLVAASSA